MKVRNGFVSNSSSSIIIGGHINWHLRFKENK